jgi:hypothetical protein
VVTPGSIGAATNSSNSSSVSEALACFPQAVQRSGAGGSGLLLRPYVELHALRLQLLTAAATAHDLQLVASYCFSQDAVAAVQQALAAAAAAAGADGVSDPGGGVPIWHHATEGLVSRAGGRALGGAINRAQPSHPQHQHLAAAWLLLWDDCCAALAHGHQQWLAATKEQLYPASYALAKAWMLLGYPHKAAAELQPLFRPEAEADDAAGAGNSGDAGSNSRSRFCIAMCQLEDAAWPEEEEEAPGGSNPGSSTPAPQAAAVAVEGAVVVGDGAGNPAAASPRAAAAATAAAVAAGGDAVSGSSGLGGALPCFGGWGGEEEVREFYSGLRQCLLLYLQVSIMASCLAVGGFCRVVCHGPGIPWLSNVDSPLVPLNVPPSNVFLFEGATCSVLAIFSVACMRCLVHAVFAVLLPCHHRLITC